MKDGQTTNSGTRSARSDFARRLRELRVPRGFRTARSFARALDIDENRYTRYERAEVEPDLAMIRKICQLLRVSADDLLGPDGHDDGAANAEVTANAGARYDGHCIGASDPDSGARLPVATSAWTLAETVTALRRVYASNGSGPVASPLADLEETSTLYRAVMRQPFEAIRSVVSDPAVLSAPPDRAQELRQRIDALVARLKEAAAPDPNAPQPRL
jgi:transcriptional regulator with XRE-family HTH domain